MSFSSVKYLFREGVRNVWVNRLMSIASVCVLFSCMLLIGAAVLASANVDELMVVIESQNVAMVYLDDGLTDAQIQKVGSDIAAVGNVEKSEFVSKDVGLQRQLDIMGADSAEFFEGLQGENNPLPNAYQVTVSDLSQYDETIRAFGAISGVDRVRGQSEIASVLSGARRIVTVVGVILICLLFVISLFIISNTIKLTMYVRKLEINIMKAVGATDWFIRIPFVIEGMLLGIFSGLITLVCLYYCYKVVKHYLDIQFLGFGFVAFSSVAWYLLAGFIIIGVLAGVFGSMISINKYLKREGSEFNAV